MRLVLASVPTTIGPEAELHRGIVQPAKAAPCLFKHPLSCLPRRGNVETGAQAFDFQKQFRGAFFEATHTLVPCQTQHPQHRRERRQVDRVNATLFTGPFSNFK